MVRGPPGVPARGRVPRGGAGSGAGEGSTAATQAVGIGLPGATRETLSGPTRA